MKIVQILLTNNAGKVEFVTMKKLSLREVTRENWRDTLKLTVSAEQHFVANYEPIAAIVLAKAYIRPGGLVWTPYAFYAETDMIGLAALAYKPDYVQHLYKSLGFQPTREEIDEEPVYKLIIKL